MNRTTKLSIAALLALLMLCASAAQAQTTAFTYQGRLNESGSPATGSYDLQFKLCDALTDGAQIGATNSLTNATVTGGVFSVQLDFGVFAFPGANRWLEISVRLAGGEAFTTLTPRQPVTAMPYAIKSLTATAADSVSAACAGCVTSSQINNINSSQINGTISGSQLSIPLSLNGSSDTWILRATNNGTGMAVFGESNNGFYGVYGVNSKASGSTVGVYGASASSSGTGVYGIANSSTGGATGVVGSTFSSSGGGVVGIANSATGT